MPTTDELAARIEALIPPGAVMAYAGEVTDNGGVVEVRPGWLLCNGAAVSDQKYPRLFQAIQASHGNGQDKSSPLPGASFNLPDFRGLFLRGVDGGRGRDPDKGSRGANHLGGNIGNRVGSVQDDSLHSHEHGLAQRIIGDTRGGFMNGVAGGGGSGSIWDIGIKDTDSAGGNETRPKNAYVHWIIKT